MFSNLEYFVFFHGKVSYGTLVLEDLSDYEVPTILRDQLAASSVIVDRVKLTETNYVSRMEYFIHLEDFTQFPDVSNLIILDARLMPDKDSSKLYWIKHKVTSTSAFLRLQL